MIVAAIRSLTPIHCDGLFDHDFGLLSASDDDSDFLFKSITSFFESNTPSIMKLTGKAPDTSPPQLP